MATMLRSLARQGRSLHKVSKVRLFRLATVPFLDSRASISTSDKKKDVTTTVQPLEKSSELERLTKHFADTDSMKEENWTSYGYEPGDRDTDWFHHNLVMFLVITLGFCWGGFILAYMPDHRFNDWCQREAFLELERREREGLPLVDPNYVNIDTIELPSEEEIGNEEVFV